MAMNYKEVPRELSGKEAGIYAQGIQIMSDLANSLQGQGLLPERFAESEVLVPPKADESQSAKSESVRMYPEISLGEEWKRQTTRLIELGFHTELGFKTAGEYVATLPQFESQPEAWKGRMDLTSPITYPN